MLREKRGERNLLASCGAAIILRSLFGNFYDKMSHIMPSSSRDQSKRSITKQMPPALASQLESLWKESQSQTSGFQEPEMQQITKVGILFSTPVNLFTSGECATIQEGRSKFWLQLSSAQKSLGAPIREAPGGVEAFVTEMSALFYSGKHIL